MAQEAVAALAGIIFFVLALIALAVFLFVFWIWMLVDALQRKFKDTGDKIVWVLVILFLHVLGALLYYLVVKRHARRKR